MLSKYLSNTHLVNRNSTDYKPHFFRINAKSDKNLLLELFQRSPQIQVFDQIQGQLKELIKLLHPAEKLNDGDYQNLISKHLNGCDITEYGVWVYYPWSNRLVHILDEKEFIEVRTNRNCYKITPEEKDVLATKKIGVVGLSVGQSVAVTLAMERCCGEIRLADFDILELTNLNRIRIGVHNLGLNKAYSVAREISEIDPFLKVSCFSDGLTAENIDDYFNSTGKLDVVIDECDSLNIKVLIRQFSKKNGIPVIMETSDRGMIDIERFDLDQNRPILHGLIEDNMDPFTIDRLSPEERMKLIFKIVDYQSISESLKYSLNQIGKTITTWPQLASSVTMGGGIVTDICRRIFLNKHDKSGRYYIDIEKLI